VKKSLKVCKDATIKRNLEVGGNSNVHGDSTVKGNQTIEGNQTVKGDATFEKDVTVCGTLDAKGGIVIDGCLEPIGKFTGVATIEECIEIPCDLSVNISELNIHRELIVTDPLPAPFDNFVKTAEECPTPGDPGTFSQDETKQTEYIILTNEDEVGNDTGVVGPWYFQDDPSGKYSGTVLSIGCPEAYLPNPGGPDDSLPTIGTAFNRTRISFDQNLVTTDNVFFKLNLAWSTEATYDFLYVYVNRNDGQGDQRIIVRESTGPEEDPFLQESFDFNVPKDWTILVEYFKDFIWYGGIDKCFFYLTDVGQANQPDFPNELNVIRDGEVIFNYGSILNLDDPDTTTETLLRELEFMAGDQICIVTDQDVYSKFDVELELLNQYVITCHFEENEHKAPIIANEITYNFRPPNDPSQIGGWYESDDTVNSIIFVEETQDGILVKSWDVWSSGPFYLNDAFFNRTDARLWPRVAPNLYAAESTNEVVYRFNPTTGDLLLDYQNDPELLFVIGAFGVRYRRVGNPNERFWQYLHDLQDYEHIFNNPIQFFDFVYNYYLSGFPTAYVDRSVPIAPGLNPPQPTNGDQPLDITQIKRSFGSMTRKDYDNVYRKLRDFGIKYKHGVDRFVYWAYPDSGLTSDQKEALQWIVNHNRYGFLGFVPTFDFTKPETYPKLFPGEEVYMKGSGTRLDDFPLRLGMSGYHTGPKPAKEFMQDEIFDEWGLYSIRLPIVIDETNDTIWTEGFDGPRSYVFEHGTYYINDLLVPLTNAFQGGQIGCYIEIGNSDTFSAGFTTFIGQNNIFDLHCDWTTYGPTHPEYPSTFFGTTGLDIGYSFDVFGDQIIPDFVDVFFNLDNAEIDAFEVYGPTTVIFKYPTYKAHTPLTSDEAQALLDNQDSIKIKAKHGPITNDISYLNLVACINELSMGRSTEDHSLVAPWTQKADVGQYELIPDFDNLIERLNQIVIPPSQGFSSPFFQFSPDAVEFAPTLYANSMRVTGVGHPGEFSEMYNSGAYRALTAEQSRGEGRLEWIVPQDKFYYTEDPTNVPTISPDPAKQNVFNREVEISVVNYVENPVWLLATKKSDPRTYDAYDAPGDAPAYGFLPFVDYVPVFATTLNDPPPPGPLPDDVQVVSGEWLVGTLVAEKIIEILNLPPDTPENELPVIGYISHYSTGWTVAEGSDQTLLPWWSLFEDAPGTFFGQSAIGIAGAGTVLRYFNDIARSRGRNALDHLIVDQRNTVGGGSPFWASFASLIGDDRLFASSGSITKIMPLDSNSVGTYYDDNGLIQAQIDSGLYPEGTLDPRECKPSTFAEWLSESFWNGEIAGHPANMLWFTNSTTISATQNDYMILKSCSLDQTLFSGAYGKDTQFIGYGVYYRPFSTGGNYLSYINWWTMGRAGEEEITNGLMWGLDRWEISRGAFVDQDRSVVKAIDQDFGNLHRPNIKWDMNSDVFFQDIGFTKDAPLGSIDPVKDGEPWICKRYDNVNFCEPLTFRDTALERAVEMVNDPNVQDNFYVDNGYGDIVFPC